MKVQRIALQSGVVVLGIKRMPNELRVGMAIDPGAGGGVISAMTWNPGDVAIKIVKTDGGKKSRKYGPDTEVPALAASCEADAVMVPLSKVASFTVVEDVAAKQ